MYSQGTNGTSRSIRPLWRGQLQSYDEHNEGYISVRSALCTGTALPRTTLSYTSVVQLSAQIYSEIAAFVNTSTWHAFQTFNTSYNLPHTHVKDVYDEAPSRGRCPWRTVPTGLSVLNVQSRYAAWIYSRCRRPSSEQPVLVEEVWQTDRQTTPVCLSHASLTVVCSTNLGVQQGNHTARIDNRSLAKESGRRRAAKPVLNHGQSVSQSVLYRVKLGHCRNMDRWYEKFRTMKCMVHIPNNLI